MIKQTLRQALTMMKQHKLFTGIYITGTAVSIAITMILFIVFYINLGKIYPEYHRGEILYLGCEWHKYNSNGGSSNMSDYFNLDFVEALKSECKHMKAMALYDVYASYNRHPITADSKSIEIEERIRFVSDGWWQVFDYKFIDGKGFTEKEMHENVAVVSESLAMQLFASTKVAGREIKINGKYHRIVGVVKDVTQCTPDSYGKIWLTIYNGFASLNTYAIHNDEKHYKIYTRAHDGEREMLLQEIENIFSRYYQPTEKEYDYELHILNHWQNALFLAKEDNIWDAIRMYIYIILAVLFIPALNLGENKN